MQDRNLAMRPRPCVCLEEAAGLPRCWRGRADKTTRMSQDLCDVAVAKLCAATGQ